METNYDVIVCGGGPGGVGAAVGAARAGAKVLLIEKYGFLGGGATAMLVNPFMPYVAGGVQLVKGVFQEILDRLNEKNAYKPRAYDPEAMKIETEELCLDAGVKLLYHSFLADCTVEDGKIKNIRVATKDGLKTFTAKMYVDSTGDGDLAYFAGVPTKKGRDEDGHCQPMTMNFRMANVDQSKRPPVQEMTRLYVEAKKAGKIKCPRENVLIFSTLQDDVIHFNQTRVVMHDAVDPESLTDAEIEARRQVWEIALWLIREVPGFENAYIQQTAPQIGVSASRRLMGEYVLTAEDLLSAKKFDDVIACGAYDIDIHNPTGEGTVIKRLPPGEFYNIPYRAIVPQKVDNLLIGGRSISTTHEAHSSIRIIPIVYGIGHGAGVAAALCAKAELASRELDVAKLQTELLRQGAFLG